MSDTPQDSFESSLIRLQQLVQNLESGDQGLEASLSMFEEGTRLLRDCYQRLEHAEQRIAILTGFDSSGNPVTAPFDASSTLDQVSNVQTESGKKPARRRSTKKADSLPEGEQLESDLTGQGELPF